MNKYLLIITMLLFSTNVVVAQEMEFKVQYSENYAILDFLQNLSSSRGNPFKDKFEKSKYNTEKYKKLIKEFSGINYFYWYEYSQYPYGNKIEGGTYFILGRNLIQSKNFEEFRKKSFGIIPNADLMKLTNVLSEFQIVYNEVVYNPSKEKFNKQLARVTELIQTVDTDKFFNKIKHFHKSSWDNSIPFEISLFPIPHPRARGFTATAFYNQAISAIPQGLSDYDLLLSVMFHEAFHILYDEQALDVKNEISDWFKSHSSSKSVYASLLLNEAITTSLANGYLYRGFAGKLPETRWYNNDYISEMAQKMFPMIEEYLNSGKQIDQSFIHRYIDIFDNDFPEWFTDINHIMSQRFIISENKGAYKAIRKAYRMMNIDVYKSEFNTLVLEEIKNHPITKVIIITDEYKSKLALVKHSFPELKNWMPDSSSDFTHVQFLDDKTYLIIVNSIKTDVIKLLEKIKL